MNKKEKIKLMNFIYDSIGLNFDNRPLDFSMSLLSNGTIYLYFGEDKYAEKISLQLKKESDE